MADFGDDALPDPPSPTPKRMMAVGAALAEYVKESNLRVALVASSSWSHAFLVDKTWRIRPDTEADRVLYQCMVEGEYDSIAGRRLAELEGTGQQEVLNWHVLFGAMQGLDRIPAWSTLVESDVFNSNKVFAIYPTTE